MIPYEQLLDADADWAMSEGSRHFEEGGAVQAALREISRRLRELEIPHAIAGGMALFAHGLRRFTEGVDLLVTAEDLKRIHHELEGAGYRPPFLGSKNLRDAESGVRIEFIVTGQFPGDGKPKPVAFPLPEPVAIDLGGIYYLNLPTLVELKLASGMTNPQRVKDLADVQELIKLLALPTDFAQALNPYVRARYMELWQAAQDAPQRFLRLWAHESGAPLTFDALAASSPESARLLQAMRDDGVTPETAGDLVYLVTTDPAAARKYDMHEASEFLG